MTLRFPLVFVLTLATGALAQPLNDTCASAEELTFAAGTAVSTIATQLELADAGAEAPIQCSTLEKNSVWYTFVAPSSGTYGLDTCDRSTVSTVMEVYSGTCAAPVSLGSAACNLTGCSPGARLNGVTLTAGTRYYVQVAPTATTITADHRLQLRAAVESPFPNESCGGTLPTLELGRAVVIGTKTSTNGLATNDAEVTSGDACFQPSGTHSATSNTGADLAFRYVPPSADPVSFRLGNARSTTSNPVLMLANTCLGTVGPYTAANGCVAAANRVTGSGTEELSCVSLAPDAGYVLWVDTTTLSTTATSGSLYNLEVATCYPEREPNNTVTQPSGLQCPTTGTFPVGDIDYFAVGLYPGARLYALVESNASNNTDTQLRLVTETDTLEYDDNDATADMGASGSVIAGAVLPDAGVALRVNMVTSVTTPQGPYRLHTMLKFGTPKLETEPNNVATSDRGDFFAGTLGTGDTVDRFLVSARAGDVLFVAVDGAPTRTAGANVNVQLYDELGWLLFDANDTNASIATTPSSGQLGTTPSAPGEAFVFRATNTGDYVVHLTSAATSAPYHLAVSVNCGFEAPRLDAIGTADGGVPATGTVLGGEVVTLTGLFNGSTQIFFGTTQATITAQSASQLSVLTPAGNEGQVDVVAINFGGGRAELVKGFTYVAPNAPPTVTGVQPTFGAQNATTNVTITGTLFKSAPTVPQVTFTVGSTTLPCTNVAVINATELTCTAPALPVGFADVTVTNPADNLPGTLTSAFEYAAAPTLTSATPNTGLTTGGVTVTLAGTGFRPGARVFFGLAEATNVSVAMDGLSLTVSTPVAIFPGAVSLRVRNADGQEATLAQGYTYVAPPPSLVGVTPNRGFASGGQSLLVLGLNFLDQPTVPTVRFGTVPAARVGFVSSQQLAVTTPAHDAGVVDLVVTNADGQTVTLPNAFTFAAAPGLSAVTPARGPVRGGTRLTLTGTALEPGARVFVGSFPTVATRWVSATTVETTTMSGAAGTYDVTVENPDGQRATLAQAFSFEAAPALTSISPSSGSTLGGSLVTLVGAGFRPNATVQFGGLAATTVTFVSDTELRATTPASPVGVVSVTVTNDDGQSSTLPRAWRFATPPTVISLAPSTGDVLGGTEVVVTGTGFTAGSSVSFDGTAATRVTLLDATRLRVVTPAGAPGPATVEVVNANGDAAQLADAFTYTRGAPTLASATPSSALSTGGAPITLIGTGFSPTVTVRFGAVPAASAVVEGSDTIRVRAPMLAAGTVDVVVTNDDGQAATLPGFVVVDPPTDQTPVVRDGGDGALLGDAGIEPPPPPSGCGCGTVDAGLAALALLGLVARRRRPSGDSALESASPR